MRPIGLRGTWRDNPALVSEPPDSILKQAGGFVLALGLAGLGGWLFWSLHAPLPWLLGAMIACALAAIAGVPISTPSVARPPMTALVGTMLGASFTADTFARAGEWIVPLALLCVFLIVGGGAGYLVLRRLGGLDRPTAFFAGMPGGLIEMVTLGKDFGGDERMIALAHAARIFFVVLRCLSCCNWRLGNRSRDPLACPFPSLRSGWNRGRGSWAPTLSAC